MDTNQVKLKKWSREIFSPYNLTQINQGIGYTAFSAPYLLVRYFPSSESIEVTHFTDDGKHFSNDFIMPDSISDLVRKINYKNPNKLIDEVVFNSSTGTMIKLHTNRTEG